MKKRYEEMICSVVRTAEDIVTASVEFDFGNSWTKGSEGN